MWGHLNEKLLNQTISEEKKYGDVQLISGKTDLEIWRAFKAGDEIAFIHIYNQYFNTLFRYASQFSRDRNFIKDAIQDLFFELIRKRSKLSDTKSIKFYLLKSIKVNIISQLKRKKIDYHDSISGFQFGLTLSVEDKIISLQLDEEKKLRINHALNKLKTKQREIIYYYYFEDLELSEIAALMHFNNPKSAQNLLYRALNSLKSYLLTVELIVLVKCFQFI